MAEPGRSYCPRCGARLRRGQPIGTECDPCRRAHQDRHPDLPWAGYVPQSWKAPLADYDFRWLFRQVRAQTGWSQQTLGGVVDLAQAQVSAIERGTTRLIHVRLVAGVAQGMRIPGHLLGFPDYGPAPDRDSGAP
ncbi:MAG: helix-turn-helix domain-containing protein [Pseudonocardiaceae bacterium]